MSDSGYAIQHRSLLEGGAVGEWITMRNREADLEEALRQVDKLKQAILAHHESWRDICQLRLVKMVDPIVLASWEFDK